MSINQFELLNTRRFLPLFISQFLGSFNDNIFKNALVILITYRFTFWHGWNAQLLVSMAAGVFILPFFLFSATAGQLADKYSKSNLLRTIKFFEIILALIAALSFYLQNVAGFMFVLFLLGTQAAFFGPVKYAILPEQLKDEELIAGNGLMEAGTFIAILLGMLIGGILILLPVGDGLVSAIILAMGVLGFISSIFVPHTQSQNPNLKVSYNFLGETIKVVRAAKEKWEIYLAILGISWFWLIGGVLLAEIPVFAKNILNSNEQVVNLFLAIFSIGIALGSLFCNRLLKGKIHATYVPIGALGMTLFLIDLCLASKSIPPSTSSQLMGVWSFLGSINGTRISFDLLATAFFGGLYTVPLYAIMQKESDIKSRARMVAANNILNSLFMAVAAFSTILMYDLGFSVSEIFFTVAIANSVVAVYICRLLPEALLRPFLTWLLKFLYNVEIIGYENYENAGNRVVIVANHTSFLDAALLATFLPDRLTYAIDVHTAKKWWIRIFLRIVDAYPLNPTNSMAIKSLIEYVREDKRCVIFPEGRITMTGALMKIYEGPGLIADKAHAKLLPIRIQGAQFTPFSRLHGKVRIRWFPKITLTIFPAQTLDVANTVKGRQRRQQISIKLYDLMRNVIFESSNYTETIFESLIDAKVTHGRGYKVAEDVERVPITYQQLIMRSFVLGRVFAKKTKPGEHVGVLLPNSLGITVVFFALQAYTRVPAMLNFTSGIKNLLAACVAANIKTVYTAKRFLKMAKLEEMGEALVKAGVNVIYLEDIRPKIHFYTKLKGFIYAQFPTFAHTWINRKHEEYLSPDAEAAILFTSGSEGTPKGVVLTHKNIQANRYQISSCVDFNASDRILNALPVFHSFGLTAGMLLPLLSGVYVFFYPSPLHYRIVPELAYDMNATILFGTDTFLTGYAKYASPYDFYSVRYIFAGAEKLRPETQMNWMQKFGIRILEGYGVTETSPVLTINTPMQYKAGTVGRLMPGIKFKLKSIPGIKEGGEFIVSGPNIMKGYLTTDNPGIIIPPPGGWYDTGDVVTVDEMGFVTIIGRVKRFAKIGGEMVSLAMVEQYISRQWPDHQHVVINMPDVRKGEQLVLLTTNFDLTRDKIVEVARLNHIAEIAIPKQILYTKEMPLLGSGKINYAGAKEYVLANYIQQVEEEDEDDLESVV